MSFSRHQTFTQRMQQERDSQTLIAYAILASQRPPREFVHMHEEELGRS